MPGPVQADGLFFACAKSKVKSTHKGKTPYGSPAPPDDGGRCAAVQHLTFFEKCAASGTGMRGIRPRAAGPFSDARKGTKSAHKGYPPYGTPGRVPAFGWAEGTRMSQPAPTCFLPRQALSLAPGRTAKPHYSVPDRAGLPSLPGWGTRGGVADP